MVARYSESVILKLYKKELMMIIEKMSSNEIFEQKLPYEIERKFIPVFPEQLEQFRTQSRPIEQFYLSHVDEPFSLRLRAALSQDGSLTYTATLKDAGKPHHDGLQRLEVEVPITEDMYAYFQNSGDYPTIRKLRAEPLPGLMIDFYDDSGVLIEAESQLSFDQFVHEHDLPYMEVTGDTSATNEWMAHRNFRRHNSGDEALVPLPELEATLIVNELLQDVTPGNIAAAHITGRSGSGKSTLVREVQQRLESLGISCTTLSTDDYHRGERWLRGYSGGEPWTHWDDPIVYDTKAMADDLVRLRRGEAIMKRFIDFTDCEPKYDGTVRPAQVMLVEGIYAGSRDIYTPHARYYQMPTPLATCVGRRLLRDMRERPEFADPAKSLLYMLTQAEPAYQNQLTTMGASRA
jgi:uridine kinase